MLCKVYLIELRKEEPLEHVDFKELFHCTLYCLVFGFQSQMKSYPTFLEQRVLLQVQKDIEEVKAVGRQLSVMQAYDLQIEALIRNMVSHTNTQ